MAFAVEQDGGRLCLTLDTPHSPVNVFDHTAAAEVEAAMAALDPAKVEVVIFRSAKPMSFVNGVGLMLAEAIHTPQDAIRLTEATRRAFAAIRNAPVPTIAAIQGNCYGCGVELTLHCDMRLASDSFDTHFYMTEMNDYLFIPAFGGTQNLPPRLGLRKAIDFVLWGEQWTAEEARRHGLVDLVFPAGEFDRRLEELLRSRSYRRYRRRVARRPATVAQEQRILDRALRRIDRLPPHYHRVYRDCLTLLAGSARKSRVVAGDYRRELTQSARSVIAPSSKSALSFFFIRQTAQSVCLRGERPLGTGYRLLFPAAESELDPWRASLADRHLGGVSVEPLPERYFTAAGEDAAATFTFIVPGRRPAKLPMGSHSETVAVRLRLTEQGTDDSSRLLLYSPFPGKRRLIEVALAAPPTAGARRLFRLLATAGFPFFYSTPGGTLALNRVLVAYFAPLVAHGLAGGDPGAVDATLRELGFVHRAAALLDGLGAVDDRLALARLLAPQLPSRPAVPRIVTALGGLAAGDYHRGKPDHALGAAVLLSLAGSARSLLEEKVLAHPSFVDLIARELLDFPLSLKSLCSHATRAETARWLKRSAAVRLLGQETVAAARSYAGGGRDFYLTLR